MTTYALGTSGSKQNAPPSTAPVPYVAPISAPSTPRSTGGNSGSGSGSAPSQAPAPAPQVKSTSTLTDNNGGYIVRTFYVGGGYSDKSVGSTAQLSAMGAPGAPYSSQGAGGVTTYTQLSGGSPSRYDQQGQAIQQKPTYTEQVATPQSLLGTRVDEAAMAASMQRVEKMDLDRAAMESSGIPSGSSFSKEQREYILSRPYSYSSRVKKDISVYNAPTATESQRRLALLDIQEISGDVYINKVEPDTEPGGIASLAGGGTRYLTTSGPIDVRASYGGASGGYSDSFMPVASLVGGGEKYIPTPAAIAAATPPQLQFSPSGSGGADVYGSRASQYATGLQAQADLLTAQSRSLAPTQRELAQQAVTLQSEYTALLAAKEGLASPLVTAEQYNIQAANYTVLANDYERRAGPLRLASQKLELGVASLGGVLVTYEGLPEVKAYRASQKAPFGPPTPTSTISGFGGTLFESEREQAAGELDYSMAGPVGGTFKPGQIVMGASKYAYESASKAFTENKYLPHEGYGGAIVGGIGGAFGFVLGGELYVSSEAIAAPTARAAAAVKTGKYSEAYLNVGAVEETVFAGLTLYGVGSVIGGAVKGSTAGAAKALTASAPVEVGGARGLASFPVTAAKEFLGMPLANKALVGTAAVGIPIYAISRPQQYASLALGLGGLESVKFAAPVAAGVVSKAFTEATTPTPKVFFSFTPSSPGPGGVSFGTGRLASFIEGRGGRVTTTTPLPFEYATQTTGEYSNLGVTGEVKAVTYANGKPVTTNYYLAESAGQSIGKQGLSSVSQVVGYSARVANIGEARLNFGSTTAIPEGYGRFASVYEPTPSTYLTDNVVKFYGAQTGPIAELGGESLIVNPPEVNPLVVLRFGSGERRVLPTVTESVYTQKVRVGSERLSVTEGGESFTLDIGGKDFTRQIVKEQGVAFNKKSFTPIEVTTLDYFRTDRQGVENFKPIETGPNAPFELIKSSKQRPVTQPFNAKDFYTLKPSNAVIKSTQPKIEPNVFSGEVWRELTAPSEGSNYQFGGEVKEVTLTKEKTASNQAIARGLAEMVGRQTKRSFVEQETEYTIGETSRLFSNVPKSFVTTRETTSLKVYQQPKSSVTSRQLAIAQQIQMPKTAVSPKESLSTRQFSSSLQIQLPKAMQVPKEIVNTREGMITRQIVTPREMVTPRQEQITKQSILTRQITQPRVPNFPSFGTPKTPPPVVPPFGLPIGWPSGQGNGSNESPKAYRSLGSFTRGKKGYMSDLSSQAKSFILYGSSTTPDIKEVKRRGLRNPYSFRSLKTSELLSKKRPTQKGLAAMILSKEMGL